MAQKQKLPPTLPRWIERELYDGTPRLALSRGEHSARNASGRSPDLASQTRRLHSASLPPAAFPIQNQWLGSRQLREHHSGGTAREFHPLPYSPRSRGTRSSINKLKELKLEVAS